MHRIAETPDHKVISPSFFKPLKTDSNRHDAEFLKFANDYIDHFYFPFNPTLATQLGVHKYDNRLEDYSKSGILERIKVLKKYETQLKAFDKEKLSELMQGSYELLLNSILSELLTLEVIKPWEKDPHFYSSRVNNAVFVIMSRKFAPLEDRVRSVIAREKEILTFLKSAQENLNNPPKIYTEIALEQISGVIQFFKRDLTQSVSECENLQLLKQFEESNTAVIEALILYQDWLKSSLLPESKGDFRMGEDAYRKKLMFDEMVDIPLDQLIDINMKNMRANQEEFKRIASEIDSTKTPQEILAQLNANYPAPENLLTAFSATFDGIIQFIQDKNIITICSDVRPIMQETPPFLRSTTFASMDTPGPYEEAKVNEAYFNVTLPNPEWTPDEVKDFMQTFNYGQILSTAVHETYPGHYIQFLWMQKIQDPVRRIMGANTNIEGWAHYCEQMMLDEGLASCVAKDAQAAKFMRLGQLVDALLRNARFFVGIKMHTSDMSMEEAIHFFVNEGYQPRMVALSEVKRGTADPTYLYYTLGKLQILKLREDVRAKHGTEFSLKQFHDDFMQQGLVPIKIIRRAMLNNDSDVLEYRRTELDTQSKLGLG